MPGINVEMTELVRPCQTEHTTNVKHVNDHTEITKIASQSINPLNNIQLQKLTSKFAIFVKKNYNKTLFIFCLVPFIFIPLIYLIWRASRTSS